MTMEQANMLDIKCASIYHIKGEIYAHIKKRVQKKGFDRIIKNI